MDFAKHTAVVHAVESESIHLTKVQVLSNYVEELWDFGCDGRNGFILVEGKWSVVHDRLVVIWSVLVGDEVIIVFIKVVLKPLSRRCIEMFLVVVVGVVFIFIFVLVLYMNTPSVT